MPYLKATLVGLIAALFGAVLTVLVPLCVQLIRLRMMLARTDVGAGSFGFVLGGTFGAALLVVVATCFVGGFWWAISRGW